MIERGDAVDGQAHLVCEDDHSCIDEFIFSATLVFLETRETWGFEWTEYSTSGPIEASAPLKSTDLDPKLDPP